VGIFPKRRTWIRGAVQFFGYRLGWLSKSTKGKKPFFSIIIRIQLLAFHTCWASSILHLGIGPVNNAALSFRAGLELLQKAVMSIFVLILSWETPNSI